MSISNLLCSELGNRIFCCLQEAPSLCPESLQAKGRGSHHFVLFDRRNEILPKMMQSILLYTPLHSNFNSLHRTFWRGEPGRLVKAKFADRQPAISVGLRDLPTFPRRTEKEEAGYSTSFNILVLRAAPACNDNDPLSHSS